MTLPDLDVASGTASSGKRHRSVRSSATPQSGRVQLESTDDQATDDGVVAYPSKQAALLGELVTCGFETRIVESFLPVSMFYFVPGASISLVLSY